MRKYWVNTVSLDHVRTAVEGGFTQADHGRPAKLKRLSQGDWLVHYAAQTAYQDGKPYQRFVGLGELQDIDPYQFEASSDFRPWRRKVRYAETEAAEIRPLLDDLEFIPDKSRWGLPFRRGLFEVSERDFRAIAKAMGTTISE